MLEATPRASTANSDPDDSVVLGLLPPGALVPARYRQVRDQLRGGAGPARPPPRIVIEA